MKPTRRDFIKSNAVAALLPLPAFPSWRHGAKRRARMTAFAGTRVPAVTAGTGCGVLVGTRAAASSPRRVTRKRQLTVA